MKLTKYNQSNQIKSSASYLLVFFTFLVFSLIFSNLYTGGDQVHYHKFYEVLPSLDLKEGYIAMFSFLGGSEPVYFFITWIFSRLVGKNIIMSLFNAFLAVSVFHYLRSRQAHSFVICLLLFNFYHWVLFFAAERLKFGVLIFLATIIFTQSKHLVKKWRWFGYLLSTISHFQMLIAVSALTSMRFGRMLFIKLNTTLSMRKVLLLYVLSPVMVFAIVTFGGLFQAKLALKMDAYSDTGSIMAILKPSLFLVLSLLYAKNDKIGVVFVHLPLIVASYFIGSERLVMFSFFAFIYYGLRVKKGLNVGVIAASCYFMVKGVVFLYDVAIFGNGFAR